MRAVGVDLGGTNLRAALVDVETGAIVGSEAKAPINDKTPQAMAELVAKIVDLVDPAGERFGVGVGFAGMLRGWTGVVVNAPNFGWREVDFRALLRAKAGPRTELYNDLNAIAFGETLYGGGRGVRDVLCVYVGTGVGAGIVIDGRLYTGANHLAGEIGHVKVRPGGRRCGCGAEGCIEAYASGKNIQARALEELGPGTGRESLALELAGSLASIHAGHLDEAARRGDAYAIALWDEISEMLGRVLANAVTLLNPARLVLGGGVLQRAGELRSRTLRAFRKAVNEPSLEGFSIVDTDLGDTAGVLGAASLIAGRVA